MNQRIAFDGFWDRYGRQEFDDTDFAKALARLPKITPDGPWVAGGSVRRLVARQEQDSDFDFFFRDQAQFDAFCENMKALGGQRVNESDFNVTFRLPAAEAKPVDQDTFEGGGPELKIQAIRIAFHESLDAVLDSFDFSICQCGFDGTDLLFGQWSLFDIASKRLVPGKLRYGTSSLRRVIKYTRQGFTICGGGLADMLEQVVADPAIIQREVEYVD
jgi:hypothetical protein